MLTKQLTEQEKMQVAGEIEKLFIAQDKPLTIEKKALFVDEISRCGYPIGAIAGGIRSLFQTPLKVIKLATILDALRDNVATRSEEWGTYCAFCGNTGHVSFRNSRGYQFAFACKCQKGLEFFLRYKTARWDGRKEQEYSGEIYKAEFVEEDQAPGVESVFEKTEPTVKNPNYFND